MEDKSERKSKCLVKEEKRVQMPKLCKVAAPGCHRKTTLILQQPSFSLREHLPCTKNMAALKGNYTPMINAHGYFMRNGRPTQIDNNTQNEPHNLT